MDSRGIPIVIPGNTLPSSPKRTKKPIRREIPSSPYFVSALKNEQSLLEIYDSFAEACFNSHYNHSFINDDCRYNIQEFQKTELFPNDTTLQPSTPKRFKSVNESEISLNESKVPELQASRMSMFHSQQSQPSEFMNYESEYTENLIQVAPNVQMRQSVTTKDSLMNDSEGPSFNSYAMDISSVNEDQAQLDVDITMNDIPNQAESLQHINLEASAHNADLPKMNSDQEFNVTEKSDKDIQESRESISIGDDVIPIEDNSSKVDKRPSSELICLDTAHTTDNAQPFSPINCNNTTTDHKFNTESEQAAVEPLVESEQIAIVESTQESTHCSLEESKDNVLFIEESQATDTKDDAAQSSTVELPKRATRCRPKSTKAAPSPRKSRAKSTTLVSSSTILDIVPEAIPNHTPDALPDLTPSAIPTPTPTRRSARVKATTVTLPPPPPKRTTRARKSATQTDKDTAVQDQPPKFKKPKRLTKRQVLAEEIRIMEQETQTVEISTSEPEKEKDITVTDQDIKKVAQRELYNELRIARDEEEINRINQEFPALRESYELIERAGRGTFSKVYKAKDLLADVYEPIDQEYKVESAEGDSYVAIKVIFDISSPKRVADEIECLAMFRSSPCITPLITAFRNGATTYVVLPYIEYDHFDNFFQTMTMNDIKSYISQLLIGLKSVHEKDIMHRDVKPGNFLFNNKTKVGYLSDFGLAQKIYPIYSLVPKTANAIYTKDQSEAGFYMYDRRLPIQANRSGTKGFRAPEIMLKFPNQTTAIDIWAVGVILLIILSGKYPFFNPDDDSDGILEVAHLFGRKKLNAFTEYYGRKLQTNIPSIPEEECNLADLCRTMNKEKVDAWDSKEYLLAIDLVKNCLELIHTNRCTAAEALNHPFFHI